MTACPTCAATGNARCVAATGNENGHHHAARRNVQGGVIRHMPVEDLGEAWLGLANAAAAAIERVQELHRKRHYDGVAICRECFRGDRGAQDGIHDFEAWPCATIRALDGAE